MGLDTSHDCFHGGYGFFMRYRKAIAKVINVPYMLMEGLCEYSYDSDNPEDEKEFNELEWSHSLAKHIMIECQDMLPIKWEVLKPDPLYVLLCHSDCDGYIFSEDTKSIADRLQEIQVYLPEELHETNEKFIKGLLKAHKRNEKISFH